MTQVISIRIPSEKVAAMDRRASNQGLDRSKYLLKLVDKDLAEESGRPKRRFASAHLLGKFHSQGSSNIQVRKALQAHGREDR